MKIGAQVFEMIMHTYFSSWWNLKLMVLLGRRKHVILKTFLKRKTDINEAAVL